MKSFKQILHFYGIGFIILISSTVSQGQQPNNQISERILLELDSPLASTTAHATVEWNCINKSLTNKCLVYHNDQWFSFKVPRKGNYFLNLAAQACKASKGIQLIILEGNPCEISSYKILDCISQIRLEDVFVRLESLRPGVEYLVNVDGFLGDFCEFTMELSERPKGLPREEMIRDSVAAQWSRQESVVTIKWDLTDSLSRKLNAFHIYRKGTEAAAQMKERLPLQANAYGAFVKHYEWTDTLRQEGNYHYRIMGIRESDQYPVLLSEQSFVWTRSRPARIEDPMRKKGSVPIRLAEGTRFSMVVYDQDSNEQLSKMHDDFDPNRHRDFAVDFSEWIEEGHQSFLVLLMDEYTQAAREYYFRWTGEKVVRE
jgi:hypothetical protein